MDKEPKKQVFVSYSTKDTVKAEAIRVALEQAGILCWIAPRDLNPGAGWGGGIVQAIEECDAVLVVFSGASNGSPQVVREMELAVSKRRPLIPVRIENVMPTEDMQFFLGVSHWFNAYDKPIDAYLDDIVHATRGVLEGRRKTWNNWRQRILTTREGQIGLGVAAVLAVLLVMNLAPKPPAYPTPDKSPFIGRWKASLPDGKSGKVECQLEVQPTTLVAFSDDCPVPLSGGTGGMQYTKGQLLAPNAYRPGDQGTLLIQGGTTFAAGYSFGLFGGLKTHDPQFGEVSWSKTATDKPLSPGVVAILGEKPTWPVKDVPGLARRATDYVHKKWQADAVLMNIELKLENNPNKPVMPGGVEAVLEYYSPEQQQMITMRPGSPAGLLSPPYARRANVAEALPADFLDLPEAIGAAHQRGLEGKQIESAKLEWTGGPACGTGNFRIDNAILPVCQPGRFVGLQWFIQSALDERVWVPAGRAGL